MGYVCRSGTPRSIRGKRSPTDQRPIFRKMSPDMNEKALDTADAEGFVLGELPMGSASILLQPLPGDFQGPLSSLVLFGFLQSHQKTTADGREGPGPTACLLPGIPRTTFGSERMLHKVKPPELVALAALHPGAVRRTPDRR